MKSCAALKQECRSLNDLRRPLLADCCSPSWLPHLLTFLMPLTLIALASGCAVSPLILSAGESTRPPAKTQTTERSKAALSCPGGDTSGLCDPRTQLADGTITFR